MKSIWNTSLNILARRDHSQHELKTKLTQKFPEDGDEIENVLQRLIDTGLQSDERFSEMWLRYQVAKRRGPRRILQEAKQKGVAEQVAELLSRDEIDWFEESLACLQRKFPHGLNYDDRAKAYRFLTYRGFGGDSINYAIEACLIKD